MKKLVQSKMIGLCVTLPQILLTVYLLVEYVRSSDIWLLAMVIINILLLVVFTVYAVKKDPNTAEKPWLVGIALSYTALIALVILKSVFLDYDFPLLIAVVSWLIPIIYSLLSINAALRADEQTPKISFYIGLFSVPIVWFFAYNALLGIQLETTTITLIIAESYICIFLLIQYIVLTIRKKRFSKLGTEPQIAETVIVQKQRRLKIPTAIFLLALPQIGLLVNNFGDFVVGDFSHPLFYIIPLLCSTMLLITLKSSKLRLARLFFVGIYAAYLIYFTVVFAPLMPLGVIGLAILLGALIFVPAVALVIHIIHIVQECRALCIQFSRGTVAAVLVAGFMLLPLGIGAVLLYDKHNFNNAVEYIKEDTNPDLPVNVWRIERSLRIADSSSDDNNGWFFDSRDTIPLLSPLYTDVVTGGALPREMMNEMRTVYLHENDSDIGRPLSGQSGVLLTELDVRTTYDDEIGAYRSWIDLEMTRGTNASGAEYVTTFTLPEGVYVSDMYLDIANKRKMGILADDRAATLVYNDIVVVKRQDPAILHYVGERRLELRVFPFDQNVPRTVGFEVIYNFDTQITIDGKIAILNAPKTPDVVIANGAELISAALKKTLPKMERSGQRFAFIVDSSKGSDVDKHIADVVGYSDANNIVDADVIFASYNLVFSDTQDMDSADVVRRCGFNLALGVHHVFSHAEVETIPIIVFVTDDIGNAHFPREVAALAAAYPESPHYYLLNSDNTLTPYSFVSAKEQDSVDVPIIRNAFSYRGMPLRDDGSSEVVPADVRAASGGLYVDAISLDAALREYGSDDIILLRDSLRARILSPQTAFIVVETADQEQDLYDAQKKLLDEDTFLLTEQSLDEPPMIVYVLIIVFIGSVIAIKKRYLKKPRNNRR